ncbi:MAG: S1C family serine protease, partial [Betaproteobacteria bacterium]
YRRHGKSMLIAISALGFVAMLATLGLKPAGPALTQADIDAAVVRVLKDKTLPSPAAKAYEAVRASVVRVRAEGDSPEHEAPAPRAVGSGVVVVESGLILTNLHVVAGASRITVVFPNGEKSAARLVNAQPENDLAVIQAAVLPDDLKPATLGSSHALAEGDHVIAVGFPFGIGPSASAGVVSGLKREYRAPEASRVLSDLIQFDAAANPGSSGGPLVNAAGEVVGIVTAILSPAENGTFAGIAFAVPIQTAAKAAGLPPF